jgi:hypothetical protein
MFRSERMIFVFGLVFSVGCFAPVPVVSAPIPPSPPPRTTNTAPPNDAVASLSTPPPKTTPPSTTPPSTTPPAPKDILDDITFKEVTTWKIAGNTPMFSWSPDQSKIAFLSDYAREPGAPNSHKRYVEIIADGKINTVATITADAIYPFWLNETSILFTCSRDACGAGKNGVYLLDITTGKQTLIKEIKEKNAYFSAIPLKTGNVMIFSEYELEKPKPKYITRWEEWDATTKKSTPKESRAAEATLSKKELRTGYCRSSIDTLYASMPKNQIVVMNTTTRQQKIIVPQVSVLPGGRTMQPCFSDNAELLYFSYNEESKANQVTIVKLDGYKRPEPPKPPTPPEKDMVYDMTFTDVFSWNISGNTPIAAWSPEKTRIAFMSDFPQKENERNYKKYLEIVDLKTNAIKKIELTTDNYQPLWLNEETLAYTCYRERCGKGKSGIYLLKVSKGAPKQIVSFSDKSYAGLFAMGGNKALFFISERPAGDDYSVLPVNRWEELDLTTEKLTPREDLPKSYQEPKEMLKQHMCSPYVGSLETFAREGEMGINNYQTNAKRVAYKTTAFPYYEGDEDGVAPCLSNDVDFMIYYSRDAKAKKNKATLAKVTGYIKK